MSDLEKPANKTLTDAEPNEERSTLGPEPGRGSTVGPEPASAEPGSWCAQCAAHVVTEDPEPLSDLRRVGLRQHRRARAWPAQ